MRSTAKYAVAVLILLGSTACGGDSPTEPQVTSISGTWTYTESFSNSSAGLSCQDEGTITINQSGTNFSGSANQEGVCTDSQGNTYDNSGSGSIGGGQVSGQSVSYSAGGCDYEGTISGSPPNRMTGPVSCTVAVGGTNYVFSGTWTAIK